jgi:hypothetical protein
VLELPLIWPHPAIRLKNTSRLTISQPINNIFPYFMEGFLYSDQVHRGKGIKSRHRGAKAQRGREK